MTKNQEKKLAKAFKLYISRTKGCLTLFDKKTGLFKASISRSETYVIPQFVYDLTIENIFEPERTDSTWRDWSGREKPSFTLTTNLHETYDTFDEACARLIEKVL